MAQQNLEQQLGQLKEWQLLAFSLAISVRMFPNFALFSQLLEFGNAAQLKQIIQAMWDKLGNTGARMNFAVQLDRVEANIPKLDDFDAYGVYPARDSVVALFSTLNVLLEAEVEEVLVVAQLSQASVAQFIELNLDAESLSEEELLEAINQHELMREEMAFQKEALAIITQAKKPNKYLLADLRTLSENQGVSNLGIGLND